MTFETSTQSLARPTPVSHHRIRAAVAATALLGASAAVGIVAAPGASAAALNAADRTFMMKNAQTNLAELSLAALVPGRAKNADTTELANMTKADHVTALAKLKTLAASSSVTLPTLPSAAQLADAAKVKLASAATFDLTYDTVQVTGHQLSIADTQAEIAGGSDAATIAFAKYYLPVAQKHLDMATANVKALGGSVPVQVPAGSGGQRAADGSDHTTAYEIGGGAALLAGAALLVIGARRREQHTG